MTEEDKAKELIDKFRNVPSRIYKTEWYISKDYAKQCAIICVEEIDKELGHSFLYGDKRRVYYRKVKSILEQ